MHELSIALSIVELATEEAERRGAIRVVAVHLRLGEMSGVAPEPLLFSYGLACEGTPLEGSSLVIEEVPVMVYCPACGAETNPPSIQSLYCPVCEAPTPQVTRGKELEVVALEIRT
ncbi:MAG TPA: hydrogenase maturation nickel metallochaperone HypA [Blastocatellia bacterium]|jgi:hydrogenase nickel incorporation protein HypA/HybF